MENPQVIKSQKPAGSNRTWLLAGGFILACCCLTVAAAGAAGAFFYLTPISSTSSLSAPSLNALVTAQDLNALSAPIFIIDWKLTGESPGDHRVCREFEGISESATPNVHMNCIYNAASGASLDGIIQSFFDSGQLFADEQPIPSKLSIPYDHALYVGTHPNAHVLIDLLVLKDGRLFWASVTMMRPSGASPQAAFQEYYEGYVDVFLYEVIKLNMARTQ